MRVRVELSQRIKAYCGLVCKDAIFTSRVIQDNIWFHNKM
jgi:hypothetical protein